MLGSVVTAVTKEICPDAKAPKVEVQYLITIDSIKIRAKSFSHASLNDDITHTWSDVL